MLYYTDFSSRLRIVQISSNILCKCKCILMEVITTIAASTELGFLRMEAPGKYFPRVGRALGTLYVLDNYWLNGCFPLFRPLGVNQKYSKDLNKISSFLVSNEWEVRLGAGEVSLERRRGKRFSLFSFLSFIHFYFKLS